MSLTESGRIESAPTFSEEQAVRFGRERFGLDAVARTLPSERDQNFQLDTAAGEAFVLKIANPGERREVLELQNAAMRHLTLGLRPEQPSICPRVCPTRDGDALTFVESDAGEVYGLRLLTYLPGQPLAHVRPHGPRLLASLGRFFGRLDQRLSDFDHPAAHREFYWDLRQAERVITDCVQHVGDKQRRATVDRFLARYRHAVPPVLAELPRGVIHADGNDHNVLVEASDWQLEVTRVIDFGDMVYSYIVADLAIAAAYAMLNKADPLAAAAEVVAGYHSVRPLSEAELHALYPLICTRLCMSVCIAARQTAQVPDNEYLAVTEPSAWALLSDLDDLPPRLAYYRFRQACGREPYPDSRRIERWIQSRPESVAPVVEALGGQALVFDLSVGSRELATIDPADTRAVTQHLSRRIELARAPVGVGRYAEPRSCYTAESFSATSEELPERRTIHLGIDLFLEPGTGVHAPLDGTVHSFANNDAELDYGPTIILEHRLDEDRTFYTLYGHLSLDSLLGLECGMPVARGQRIGAVGETNVNGGWSPHLHFQLIGDMLGGAGNFPGVAAPSQRDLWLSLCPDPNVLLGIPPECFPREGRSPAAILEARRRNLGPSLSVSYRKPLKIVRGRGQYLYDEQGRAYLDAVNNVCHVGHCHPRVVRAASQQLAVLNTNTRYLHDYLVDYAERLCATLPDPLSVCFLVCTGSEANDLALRMARAHTGRRDVITVEGAYHGHTQALIDVSPYKFDGPGGAGAPPWTHKVAMPDGYRGVYRGQGPGTGALYAGLVREAIARTAADGRPPAAFLCESLLGCAGQIVPPAGYLRDSFAHVRAAGGVCIADEVQVGFGRIGSHFWAFDAQGAVPDIVTLGKPIGNGHPIGAVVTTPQVAASFATGMEYFNTFGGNPVSCAVALAVLDVIEDEGLQEHALRVGNRLISGLQDLQQRHGLIGDVRGQGLFVGLELVLDREARTPAPDHATHVIERMRDHGILISTDGPLRNVLKIKPPLVIDESDADRLVRTLDKVLGERLLQP